MVFSRWVLGGGKLEGGGNPKHPRGGNWGAPFPWQSMYPDSEHTPKMKRNKRKPFLPWVPLLYQSTETLSLSREQPSSDLLHSGTPIQSPLPREYHPETPLCFQSDGQHLLSPPCSWA